VGIAEASDGRPHIVLGDVHHAAGDCARVRPSLTHMFGTGSEEALAVNLMIASGHNLKAKPKVPLGNNSVLDCATLHGHFPCDWA
jgi:hypothetical protein